MKKKVWIVLFALISALCLCLGLAACGGDSGTAEGGGGGGGNPEGGGGGGEETHTHVAAHFQVNGDEHWKICTECGEKFSVGDHSYNSDNACETCGYSTVCTEGLSFRLDEETDTYIVGGLGEATDATDLIIPAYHEGKAVTSIGWRAFYNCSELESVTIGSSVTSIGGDAFARCSGLTSITIPSSVTEIESDAFEDCSELKEVHITDLAAWCKIDFQVRKSNPLYYAHHLYMNGDEVTKLTIPAGVTSIGRYAFRDCVGLESITVDEGNQNYSSQDGILYNKEKTTYIHIPKAIKGSVTIPDSVTSIGGDAFRRCSGLESVTIGSGVTSIGSNAFQDCSSLASITIPDGVTSIGDSAFYNCIELTSITIPDGVTSIGEYAFFGTAYYDDISHWDMGEVLYIGNHLIKAKDTISGAYVIRQGTKNIADYAFSGGTGLTSITLPDSVTSIGGYAFWGCSRLESVTIGSGVTSIGDAAFWNCETLTDIQFKGTVQEWQAIEKGSWWDDDTPDYTITCTDGTVKKDGTITYFDE